MQLYCCHCIWCACFRMQISHYAIASLVKYFSWNKHIHQKLERVSFRVDDSALWQLRDHPVFFNKLFQITLQVERSSYWICTTSLPHHRTPCTCRSHPLKGKLGLLLMGSGNAEAAVWAQRLAGCCSKAGAAVWGYRQSWLQQEQCCAEPPGLPGATRPPWASCVTEVLPAPSLRPCKLQLLPKTSVIQPKCLPAGAGRGSLAAVFCFSLICEFSIF